MFLLDQRPGSRPLRTFPRHYQVGGLHRALCGEVRLPIQARLTVAEGSAPLTTFQWSCIRCATFIGKRFVASSQIMSETPCSSAEIAKCSVEAQHHLRVGLPRICRFDSSRRSVALRFQGAI